MVKKRPIIYRLNIILGGKKKRQKHTIFFYMNGSRASCQKEGIHTKQSLLYDIKNI